MAMLITKFHKLIQNKLLWIVFLVMVVLSFVVWGTYTPSRDDVTRADAPGALDGKPVDRKEFEEARFGEYMSLVLAAGRPLNLTGEVREELAPLTWRRFISLRAVEELGLIATDREVQESIKSQPVFSADGRFDRKAYENFVRGYLGNLLQANVPLTYFEEHVRRQLSLAKLQQMIRATVLVTPFDVEQGLGLLTDSFLAAYTVVRDDDVPPLDELTEEQVRNHFEQDPSSFTIPPKVKVKYVAFAAGDFLDDLTVDPEDVETYYADNIENYRVEKTDPAEDAAGDAATTDTNEVAAVDTSPVGEADTNALAEAVVTNEAVVTEETELTFRPLEEVREEIVTLLRRQAALDRATDEAGDLVYELMPSRTGDAPEFEALVAERGITILEREPFTETEFLTDLGTASPEFVEQAFQLRPTKEEYISNPVEGDDAVYVMALVDRIPERVPSFEEVQAEAEAAAREAAEAEALMALAREVQEATRAAATEGKPMKEALADKGLEVTETDEFTVSEGLREDPYADYLRGEVGTLNTGEVTDLVPVYDGILVAEVLLRKPAESFTITVLGDQVADSLADEFAARLFPSWQDQLLKDAQFEDFDAARRAALEEEDAEYYEDEELEEDDL